MSTTSSSTASSSMTRLTGMSGIDVDSLVKTAMKGYQTKVDKQTQEKDVLEIKQKLYRQVLTDTRAFYNKYLDVAKSDSLLFTSNYKSINFSSTNDAVSVKASNESQKDNYSVAVTSLASAASAVISGTPVAGDKVTINGKEFTLAGTTQTEISKDLTTQLATAGIKVAARYTNFAGTASNVSGLVLESTVLGKNGTFTVGTKYNALTPTSQTAGADATASNVTGFNIQNVKDAGGIISVDYDGAGTGASVDLSLGLTGTETDDDIVKIINSKLDSTKVIANKDASGNITFSSAKQGASSPQFSIKVGTTTTTAAAGTDASVSVSTFNEADLDGKISINGNVVDLSGITGKTGTDLQPYIDKLTEKGLTATDNGNGTLTLTSIAKGNSSNFTVSKDTGTSSGGLTTTADGVKAGSDANVTITNLTSGGVYTHTGITNTINLDGSTFTFNSVTGATPASITAKTDVTDIKDKIVKFVNDYNTIITGLNTDTMTKHNKSYTPLTSDQKDAMSESDITLWNAQVEKGQLYRDSDISRITDNLKESMRSVMGKTGMNLEKIGITPVSDYAGTANGTFDIDEEKLTSALENNIDDVKNLFTGQPDATATTDAQKSSQTGIMYKIKSTLYSEVMKSDSALAKKVGLEGTASFTNNTITKSISDYENKITDMKKALADRQQALYSKYATLESIMNQYNSQQSYLTSALGQ